MRLLLDEAGGHAPDDDQEAAKATTNSPQEIQNELSDYVALEIELQDTLSHSAAHRR